MQLFEMPKLNLPVNEQLVEVLERYLARAKTGEIRGIAGVVILENTLEALVAYLDDSRPMLPAMIGGLEVVKSNMTDLLRNALCQS